MTDKEPTREQIKDCSNSEKYRQLKELERDLLQKSRLARVKEEQAHLRFIKALGELEKAMGDLAEVCEKIARVCDNGISTKA